MGEGIKFDYYYGLEAEQFSFIRVPKLLIKDKRFKGLSSDAKLLYGLMLDRMALSQKNEWFDAENRAYIYYTIDEIMDDLGCARATCIKIVAELDSKKGIGLIEKKRQGLGKPDIIYVKNFVISDNENPDKKPKDADVFTEVQNLDFQKYNKTFGSSKNELQEIKTADSLKSEKQISGSSKNGLQEIQNLNANNTDINNTDMNNTNLSINLSDCANHNKTLDRDAQIDRIDNQDAAAYIDLINRNVRYDYHMMHDNEPDKALFGELYELICDVVCVRRKTLTIGREIYPYELVKSKFLKLTDAHLEYVISAMQNTATKITNIKSYMLTALYNAPNTITHYYQQLAQHDMDSGWGKVI